MEDSKPKLSKDVIAYYDPSSPTAEAIKCLRTNILFLNTGKDIKVIGITSSLPQEGKSFLIGNLAVSTTQSKKKTLVIDCDLRRFGISKLFDLGGERGLTNVLTDKNEINLKDLPLYNVGVENLTILPSGPVPPNPAELLELDKVDRILEMARKEYDIIYVDIPPILSVTDPIVVAKRTDAVVFIVMANVTAVKAATRAYSLLKSANINIIGTVLNKVEMAMSEYGYGRYKYEKYYEK